MPPPAQTGHPRGTVSVMVRFGRLLVALAVLILCAALAAPAGAITKSQLRSKAFSLSDMPTGWSVDNANASASNFRGCLTGLIALEKPSKTVLVDYVVYDNQSIPSLSEYLAAGKTTKDATKLYGKYIHVLNGCTTFSFTDQGEQGTGTVGAMSFPTFGNQSESYSVSISVGGQSVNVDVVILRVGRYVANLAYEDYSPDNATVEAFAQEAAAKTEGKAVTPPTGNS